MSKDKPSGNSRKPAFHFRKCRFFYLLPCFVLFNIFMAYICPKEIKVKSNVLNAQHTGRHTLEISDVVPDCVPPSIDSFPSDFFTQEQRAKGGVVLHFLILIYLCAMLSVVCDDYFVPSLEIISQRLKLPSDVAGATFMAIGTSSPELFSSIIGAFITEGDIGIGTIVGSAVFNILGVTGLAGIVIWSKHVDVDWYPVVRDASVYVVTIAALTIIISDNIVSWWEALIMVTMFMMYIVLMYFNSSLEKFSKKHVKALRHCCQSGCCCCCSQANEERSPLHTSAHPSYSPEVIEKTSHETFHDSYSVDIPSENKLSRNKEDAVSEVAENEDGSLCSPPKGCCRAVWWFLMWPASLLFYITIPDCRKENAKKCFVVTFLSATVWLGVLSYLSVWMVTVIGFTFTIPDTVSGLTLLAVGTSLPEILSSIIVVRSGLGNMVMGNLIGSNIFDILFCLGIPWFIKTLTSGEGYLVINSSSLTYTTTTLLVTVLVLLLVFHFSSWQLNRMMGMTCILLYVIFIALACMYELNVLGDFNPPPC